MAARKRVKELIFWTTEKVKRQCSECGNILFVSAEINVIMLRSNITQNHYVAAKYRPGKLLVFKCLLMQIYSAAVRTTGVAF